MFNNLQQSGALSKVFNWFNGEVTKLNLTRNAIKGVFGKALSSLGIKKAFNPLGAFEEFEIYSLNRLNASKTLPLLLIFQKKVMEFVVEGFLNMAGGARAEGNGDPA